MEERLWSVLQRKRGFLRKNLELTGSQLAHLRDLILITQGSYETLTSSSGAGRHITNHLLLTNPSQADRFLNFLKNEAPSIHEELTAELKAEAQELKIEEQVMDEAASQIHRHFGRSRRLSEHDKKMMTSLVATRFEVSKEIWKRRLFDVTKALDKLKNDLEIRVVSIRAISDVMDTFLKQNRADLYDFSRDLKSTSQILLEIGYRDVGDVTEDFLLKVTSMLDRFKRVLFEKTTLEQQKRQTMKVLGLTDARTPLDAMLLQAVEKCAQQKADAARAERQLKTRLGALQQDMKQREKRLMKLRSELSSLKIELAAGDQRQPMADLQDTHGHRHTHQLQTHEEVTQTQQPTEEQTKQDRRERQARIIKPMHTRSLKPKETPTNKIASIVATSGPPLSQTTPAGQTLTLTGSQPISAQSYLAAL